VRTARRCRAGHQGQTGQVQHGERDGHAGVQAAEVGAEQCQQAVARGRGVHAQLGRGGQAERDRVQRVPAERVDRLFGQPGGSPGGGRRGSQGQLVPGGPQPRRRTATGPARGQQRHRAGHAHDDQRRDRHHEHQRIGDHRPGQHDPRNDRDVPAPRAQIQQQPYGQGGHGGADVPDRQQQHEDAHAQLRSQHDAAGKQDTGQALAGAGPALGQQRGSRRSARTRAARSCRRTRPTSTSCAAPGCREACPRPSRRCSPRPSSPGRWRTAGCRRRTRRSRRRRSPPPRPSADAGQDAV
jgi:hypothetical protein